MSANAHPDLAAAAADAANDAIDVPGAANPAPSRPTVAAVTMSGAAHPAPEQPPAPPAATVVLPYASANATRAAAPPSRRTLAQGYFLVLLGTALIPVPPIVPSALAARILLILCMTALIWGAALVLWGFVRNVFRPR